MLQNLEYIIQLIAPVTDIKKTLIHRAILVTLVWHFPQQELELLC